MRRLARRARRIFNLHRALLRSGLDQRGARGRGILSRLRTPFGGFPSRHGRFLVRRRPRLRSGLQLSCASSSSLLQLGCTLQRAILRALCLRCRFFVQSARRLLNFVGARQRRRIVSRYGCRCVGLGLRGQRLLLSHCLNFSSSLPRRSQHGLRDRLRILLQLGHQLQRRLLDLVRARLGRAL